MNPRSKSSSTAAGVVAFTGHMMDKVGRVPPRFVPRLPREMEDAVTEVIIATTNVGHLSHFIAADIWPNIVPSEPTSSRKS